MKMGVFFGNRSFFWGGYFLLFRGTEARLFCMALRDRKDSIFLGWMKMESTLIHDYNLKKTSDFLRLMKMECFLLG